MQCSTFTRAFDGSADCGDFVELLDLGNGMWTAIVGDVAGRGEPAGVAARRLHAYVRSLVHRGLSPRGILEGSDAFYERHLMNDVTPFASLFVASAFPGARSLAYASAGHETALLVNGKRHRHLGATGPLLGLQLGALAPFTEAAQLLSEEALLVVVTDGITDARRPDSDSPNVFGDCGLVKAIVAAECPIADLPSVIYLSASGHACGELRDDASVLAVALDKPQAAIPRLNRRSSLRQPVRI